MLAQLLCVKFATGAVILCTLSLASADKWPGDGAFDALCREIIDNVARNAIQFKSMDMAGSTRFTCNNQLRTREVISRSSLCNRLV